MGLYDRDYYRDEDSGYRSGSQSMVITLIIVNVAVYLVDVLSEGKLTQFGELNQDWYRQPWTFWKLLTYGFLHSWRDIQHILFNMIGLWIFGSDVEAVYGRRAFLKNYLSLIVLSGLVWTVAENAANPGGQTPVVGASGAVFGVMIIYIFHFPYRQFLLFFVFPVPAWLLGALYVAYNFFGLTHSRAGDGVNVAFAAHLGGALFGYVYYRTRWNIFFWLPDKFLSWREVKRKFQGKPDLRVHDDPPDAKNAQSEAEFNKREEEILAKISSTGIESLTPEERRFLQEAAKKYKEKRR